MRNPRTFITRSVLSAVALTATFAATTVQAEENAGTPPSAPRDVTVTVKGTSATVRWSAPSSSGTSPVAGYTASTRGGNNACVSTGTSCTIKGLVNGQTYGVAVRADSWAGLGALSDPVTVSVPYAFESAAGKNATFAVSPSGDFGSHVVVRAAAGRVHAGLRAPRAAKQGDQIIRYVVQVFDAAGTAVGKAANGARPGRPTSVTVQAAPGSYRVYVTAQKCDGTKVTWQGPRVTVG